MARHQGHWNITVQDEVGAREVVTFYVSADGSTTWEQVITEAQALASLFDALTGAAIIEVYCSAILGAPSGAKTAPVAGSEANDMACFRFEQEGSLRSWTLDIPAFPHSKLHGRKPNLADTDVSAFLAFLTATDGTFRYLGATGLPLLGVTDSFFSLRKARRR